MVPGCHQGCLGSGVSVPVGVLWNFCCATEMHSAWLLCASKGIPGVASCASAFVDEQAEACLAGQQEPRQCKSSEAYAVCTPTLLDMPTASLCSPSLPGYAGVAWLGRRGLSFWLHCRHHAGQRLLKSGCPVLVPWLCRCLPGWTPTRMRWRQAGACTSSWTSSGWVLPGLAYSSSHPG